jgi:NTP pyrophosphatase (non-canonical NTP hydrolase)
MIDELLMEVAKNYNDQKDWLDKNFPGHKQSARNQFYGIVEEVGELAHVVLKQSQGIRYKESEIRPKIVDAIGDILIYIVGYMITRSLGPTHIRAHPGSFKVVDREVAFNGILNAISKLSMYCNLKDIGLSGELHALSDLIFYVDLYSIALNMNAVAIYRLTWNIVKQRNWAVNPINGENTSIHKE